MACRLHPAERVSSVQQFWYERLKIAHIGLAVWNKLPVLILSTGAGGSLVQYMAGIPCRWLREVP